jgi:hypothetical protein
MFLIEIPLMLLTALSMFLILTLTFFQILLTNSENSKIINDNALLNETSKVTK